MKRVTTILILILGALLLTAPLAAQDAPADAAPVRVAIKPLEPFVIFHDDGSYSGFSIDLWNEIARRLDMAFEYTPFATVTDVLNVVRFGGAEVGIAGISITREREEFIDFSQPMFNAGLQILVSSRNDEQGLTGLLRLLSPQLLIIPLIMTGMVIVVGHIIWLVERKNPEFPDEYARGVGEGIWWAASSLLGSGDKMPKSIVGRVGALIWVLTGIFLIAYLTADLSAQNTVDQLQGTIRGAADLPGKRVATVDGTTAADYLTEARLIFTPLPDIETGYRMLEAGEVDALVYDAPVLRYYAYTGGQGRVQVVGSLFERQDYGIALPSGSSMRESIDRALLSIVEEGVYEDIYARWFGVG